MYYDIISATYAGDYKIHLIFEDGKAGIMDFTRYIEQGGVFAKLKDINYFKSFSINRELGVITWNNEVDIAPETIYCETLAVGLPTWMIPREEKESHLT